MRRARAVVVAVAALVAGACGGDRPTVRTVTGVEAPRAPATTQTPGANLIVDGTTVRSAGSATSTLPVAESVETRAAAVSADVIAAFFDALRAGAYDRATGYASGNALTLIEALRAASVCDVRVVEARSTPPTTAAVVGKATFRTDATGLLAFNTGRTQRITAVMVSEGKNGAFRVDDLEVGSASLSRLLDLGRGPNSLKAEVRVETLQLCVGPARALATFNVVNLSNGQIRPKTVFFRRSDGSTIPLSAGAETVLGQPMQPGDQVTWQFSLNGDRLWNGWLVMTAPDLEGKPTGEVVERSWQLVVAPFFSG